MKLRIVAAIPGQFVTFSEAIAGCAGSIQCACGGGDGCWAPQTGEKTVINPKGAPCATAVSAHFHFCMDSTFSYGIRSNISRKPPRVEFQILHPIFSAVSFIIS